MYQYPLEIKKGHLYITVGNKSWLIDTGSPVSFSKHDLMIGERLYPLSEKDSKKFPEELTDLIGHHTDGLLGNNVIREHDVLLDLAAGQMTFSEDHISANGLILKTELVSGIPCIDVGIKGKNYRMFFDTGAQISYFTQDHNLDYPEAGDFQDFYPFFGEFETKTYLVKVILNENLRTLRFGVFPLLLNMAIVSLKIEGIIGLELIQGRKLLLSYRRNMMILS
ncbi:MAG: hypothetical protein K0B81_09700 [Candidatus Cloacimonetes bacterium]|nr:hypothetical protein [Candidatus Cloacimonadota bacterium]